MNTPEAILAKIAKCSIEEIDDSEPIFFHQGEVIPAMQEYASQFKCGVRWVKASERLPEDKKIKHGIKSCSGFYYCRCKDDSVGLFQFKSHWGEFRDIILGCECKKYEEEIVDVEYWLDESPCSCTEEMVRYKEALEEKDLIIQGIGEGAEQWKSEYDNCREILKILVELKRIKDTEGKTEFYETNQPLAWDTAKKFLEKYQHQ